MSGQSGGDFLTTTGSESTHEDDCTGDWASVRKVRYKQDIYSAARYISDASDRYSAEGLRKAILAGRGARFGLIEKHYRSSLYSPVAPGSEGTKLSITLSDSLAFFKRIGIIARIEGKVVATPFAKRLAGLSRPSSRQEDMLIARAVMNSGYVAYTCWLRTLNAHGEATIPASLAGRQERLRDKLKDQGFFTDVASFFAIRDLFYELELCNWQVGDDGNELIYPTALVSHRIDGDWEHAVPLSPDETLLVRRKVRRDQFVQELRKAYLLSTRDRFGVEADILGVRDVVCKRLRISDQHFRDLIIEAVSERPAGFQIRLNYGTVTKKRRNYGLKILSLPMISANRIATFVRLDGVS